jgi:hypothetical protein
MMLFYLLATANIALAPPDPTAADIAWVAEGEFCEPETVLPLPDNTLLVSNVCDFKQGGNGFLSLLDEFGRVLDWRIVKGLDAPLGMAMHRNRLYVIDNNRVKILSWPEYDLLEVIDLETSVANDLAISADGVLYISDTAGHQVIQLLPNGQQSELKSSVQFKGANGMAIDNGHLFIGGERLWRLELQTGEVNTIGPDWMSDIDGIEVESDGTIQVTPVGGSLIRYRDQNDIDIIAGPGISSANHGYAETMRMVFIPTGFDNTVIAIRLPAPVD